MPAPTTSSSSAAGSSMVLIATYTASCEPAVTQTWRASLMPG